MKYRMEVTFSLSEMCDPETDTAEGAEEQVKLMQQTFAQAFNANVTCLHVQKVDDVTGGDVIYVLTVDNVEKASAVRMMLEWITTSNVAVQEVEDQQGKQERT